MIVDVPALVPLVATGQTYGDAWHAAGDDVAARRALLCSAYAAVVVSKGRKGRHGLDPARVRLVTSAEEILTTEATA